MKERLGELIAAIIIATSSATAQPNAESTGAVPIRPVNTYSIVAYDSVTGQFGAAVQSHWFKVADVIWVEPKVGVVATQSLVDFAYGPLGLEMMRLGKSSRQALDGLLASDSANAVRQVAMIDKNGLVAAHTGGRCIAQAGHFVGKHYSVQANLMRHATVWPAMSKAFETTKGDLAERMMAALEAAEREGGDIRGKQSAAMVVVSGTPTGQSWRDKIVDVRVDDHAEPLKELRRLLDITRAYDHMNRGDKQVTAGRFDSAGVEYALAARLAPGNNEIMFWHAVTLVTAKQNDLALPIFKKIFATDPSWRELVPRLVPSGLLPDDKKLILRITDQ